LTCWAEEAVAGWAVAELIFTEQARSDRGTTLWTRHVGVDPGLLAGLEVLDLEIAPVGHDRDALAFDLPARCEHYGLEPRKETEAFADKIKYVLRQL
jgi:hypothetical protein